MMRSLKLICDKSSTLLANRTLLVSIKLLWYPITEDILNQVFSPYGMIEKITVIEANAVELWAFVRFDIEFNAIRALYSLQGRFIYEGCCLLSLYFPDVEFAKQNAEIPEIAAENIADEVSDRDALNSCDNDTNSGIKEEIVNELGYEHLSGLNEIIGDIDMDCVDTNLCVTVVEAETKGIISVANSSETDGNLPVVEVKIDESFVSCEEIEISDAQIVIDKMQISDAQIVIDKMPGVDIHSEETVEVIFPVNGNENEIYVAYGLFDKMPELQVDVQNDEIVDDIGDELNDLGRQMNKMAVVDFELRKNSHVYEGPNELFAKQEEMVTLIECPPILFRVLNLLGNYSAIEGVVMKGVFDPGGIIAKSLLRANSHNGKISVEFGLNTIVNLTTKNVKPRKCKLIVIEEHHISECGHNFRVEQKQIGRLCTLGKTSIDVLRATATENVRFDPGGRHKAIILRLVNSLSLRDEEALGKYEAQLGEEAFIMEYSGVEYNITNVYPYPDLLWLIEVGLLHIIVQLCSTYPEDCPHFAAKFKVEYKIDVFQNVKTCLRLCDACEKSKKVLSVNLKASLNIECLMNENDVMSFIKKDEFEQISISIWEKVKQPLEKESKDLGLIHCILQEHSYLLNENIVKDINYSKVPMVFDPGGIV